MLCPELWHYVVSAIPFKLDVIYIVLRQVNYDLYSSIENLRHDLLHLDFCDLLELCSTETDVATIESGLHLAKVYNKPHRHVFMEALTHAAGIGNDTFIQYILHHFPSDFNNDTQWSDYSFLVGVYTYGMLSIAQCWHELTKSDEFNSKLIVKAAARNGHLPLLQWHFQTFEATPKLVFPAALEGGHVHILQWIQDNFPSYICNKNFLIPKNVECLSYYPFKHPGLSEAYAERGQVEELQFINKLQLHLWGPPSPSFTEVCGCYSAALQHNRLNVLHFLHTTYPEYDVTTTLVGRRLPLTYLSDLTLDTLQWWHTNIYDIALLLKNEHLVYTTYFGDKIDVLNWLYELLKNEDNLASFFWWEFFQAVVHNSGDLELTKKVLHSHRHQLQLTPERKEWIAMPYYQDALFIPVTRYLFQLWSLDFNKLKCRNRMLYPEMFEFVLEVCTFSDDELYCYFRHAQEHGYLDAAFMLLNKYPTRIQCDYFFGDNYDMLILVNHFFPHAVQDSDWSNVDYIPDTKSTSWLRKHTSFDLRTISDKVNWKKACWLQYKIKKHYMYK